MRLGRPERRVEARLVDRAVDQRRRGSGGRECAPGRRREALGGRDVERPLQREDVALEPGQQVEAGAETGVRELRQVGVEVDHPGQDDPRPDVGGGRRRRSAAARSVAAGVRDASVGVHGDEAVRFVDGCRPRRGASGAAPEPRTGASAAGPPRKASRAGAGVARTGTRSGVRKRPGSSAIRVGFDPRAIGA